MTCHRTVRIDLTVQESKKKAISFTIHSIEHQYETLNDTFCPIVLIADSLATKRYPTLICFCSFASEICKVSSKQYLSLSSPHFWNVDATENDFNNTYTCFVALITTINGMLWIGNGKKKKRMTRFML